MRVPRLRLAHDKVCLLPAKSKGPRADGNDEEDEQGGNESEKEGAHAQSHPEQQLPRRRPHLVARAQSARVQLRAGVDRAGLQNLRRQRVRGARRKPQTCNEEINRYIDGRRDRRTHLVLAVNARLDLAALDEVYNLALGVGDRPAKRGAHTVKPDGCKWLEIEHDRPRAD